MTNIVITMAGFGQRFRDAGYDRPKYCIEVHGKSLFHWSLASLRSFYEVGSFYFIVRAEDASSDFIRRECQILGIRTPHVIEINKPTDGQATTALLAGEFLQDPKQPFLVYNIDTFVQPSELPKAAVRGEGWIPCFPGKGEGWSFARISDNGRVEELREKVRISSHATLGLYWFASFAIYRAAYDAYYSDPARMEKGEKYIAPLYNHMIADAQPVFIHEVRWESVIPLGTPAEVEAFARQTAVEIH
ncbi:MAG TPA: glycosyltransferase family 2 protein [Oligoflexus sp.]|uniref:glycosyltransferase family 2 protein n=1 Tax=Oligoflexus sp. TaxID=1971216 RepID=UPI002D2825BE|nr:glycosyltransferase family 2 protein [Oligoflexus sp.]HYX34682.1 glycosyltransferase family 2 protein [Oligoflexus sp.]